MNDFIENWEGWLINHLAEDNSKWEKDYFETPNALDWSVGLIKGVQLKPKLVDENFLWIKKVFSLHVNPETEDLDRLETPIPIAEIRYNYGTWTGLLPEKQDWVFCGAYKENPEAEIEWKEYKLIEKDLEDLGAKDNIATGRRKRAKSWLKQRAVEIDGAIAALGLEPVNLEQGVKEFFEEYSLLMSNYINAGDDSIIKAIETVLNDDDPALPWLKKEIPVAVDNKGKPILAVAGIAVQSAFSKAVTPVS